MNPPIYDPPLAARLLNIVLFCFPGASLAAATGLCVSGAFPGRIMGIETEFLLAGIWLASSAAAICSQAYLRTVSHNRSRSFGRHFLAEIGSFSAFQPLACPCIALALFFVWFAIRAITFLH